MAQLKKDDEKSYTLVTPDGREITVAKTDGDPIYLELTGKVPGKAKVKGDSPKNDTEIVAASPGEIFIPRSHSGSLKSAIAFLESMDSFSDGGMVEESDEEKKKRKKKKDEENNDDLRIVSPQTVSGSYADGGEVEEDDEKKRKDYEKINVDADKAKQAQGSFKGAFGYQAGGMVVPSLSTDDPFNTEMQPPAPTAPLPMGPAPSIVQPLGSPGHPDLNPVPGYTGGTGMMAPAPIVPAVDLSAGTDQTMVEGVAPGGTGEVAVTAPSKVEKTQTQTEDMLSSGKKAIDKADAAFAKAAIAQAELTGTQADAQKALLESQTFRLRDRNMDDEIRRHKTDTEIQKRLEEVDRINNEYATAKVDPEHIYGDEGTANKFMATIGIILGAFGSALTGKENMAIKIVNDAIERDIKIQEFNIGQLGKKVEGARGALKTYIDVTGNIETAKDLERARMLDGFARDLDLASRGGSAEALAAAKTAIATVEQKSAALKANAGKIIQIPTEEDAKVKPLENAPPQVQASFTGLQSGYNTLDSLDKKYEAFLAKNPDISMPVQARWNEFARNFGIDEPDLTKLKAQMIETVAEEIHRISGTGSAQQEVDRLTKKYPSLADSPETFRAMIAQEKEQVLRKIEEVKGQYSGVAQLPRDVTRKGPKTFKPQ